MNEWGLIVSFCIDGWTKVDGFFPVAFFIFKGYININATITFWAIARKINGIAIGGNTWRAIPKITIDSLT